MMDGNAPSGPALPPMTQGRLCVCPASSASILVVKTLDDEGNSVVVARNLTSSELAALERNQDFLKDPRTLLTRLTHASRYGDELPSSGSVP